MAKHQDHKVIGQHIYDGMVLHEKLPADVIDAVKQFEFHDSDVVISTYVKCGTTWAQEILFLVHSEGDFERSDKENLVDRVMFVETRGLVTENLSGLEVVQSRLPPRLIKTHLPAQYFEKTLSSRQTKFITVFRNPKDMLVSYFHFYRMHYFLNNFPGTWDDFFELFKKDRLCYGNYFKNQLSWWKLRDDPRILILKYEDMTRDLEKSVRQVAQHLGKNLSDEVVEKIVKRTTFENMKNIPTLNYSHLPSMHHGVSEFMRKGSVGDWKNYFSEGQSKYIDELCKKYFESEGLRFDYEL